MIVKDNKKIITSDEIIQTPYIKRAISEFVKHKGQLDQSDILISISGPIN